MRALIQRVEHASVTISGADALRAGGDGTPMTNSIGKGYLILLGVGTQDDEATAQKLWNKIAKLRIFADEVGKTNLSLRDIGGSVLLVSQFTLYADCRKGNRPSFTQAGGPVVANSLYKYFGNLISQEAIPLEMGWFGADMQVELVNDGPFTIWLDTETMA